MKKTWADFELDTDRVVGRGGTSTVYAARQISLERPCVIKVLDVEHRDPKIQAELLRRFQNEAKLIARLSDPRIVQVIQAGESDGRLWIAMERIDGETLEAKIEARAPIDEREVRRIVVELARALQSALQTHQMIHRDIKPGNVFITKDGSVKLSDFGLARILDKPRDRITEAGTLLGTPAYMAPEVVQGEKSDHRADIYALGCLAYELVAQLPPFDGESGVDLLFKQVHEPPIPPHELQPRFSEELSTIILRCLEKKPSDRYPDYETLIADLNIPEPEPERRPRRLLPWIAVPLVAGFALLVWMILPRTPEPLPEPPAPPVAAEPDPLNEARQRFEAGDLEGALAMAPEGSQLRIRILFELKDYENVVREAKDGTLKRDAWIELGRLDEVAELLQRTGDPDDRRAWILAGLGRFEAAEFAEPDPALETILRNARPPRTVGELQARIDAALAAERIAAGADRKLDVCTAWSVAAVIWSRLGLDDRAEAARKQAAGAIPRFTPPVGKVDLDNRALMGGDLDSGRALIALAEKHGLGKILDAAGPLRREIEADDLATRADWTRILREFRDTAAFHRSLGAIRVSFLRAGFKNVVPLSDRWNVKGPEKDRVIEHGPDSIRLRTREPAYLEFDGPNPVGYRLRMTLALEPDGWGSVIVHRRSDEDMDLVIFNRERVSWSDGKERRASLELQGGTVDLEVIPHEEFLLLFSGGRFLSLIEPKGGGLPTRMRIGVKSGTLVLEAVELRQ